MTFGNALIYSLLGMAVVFFALVLLMCIIKIMTAIGDRAEKKSAPAPAGIAPPDAAAPAPALKQAGRAGPGCACERRP